MNKQEVCVMYVLYFKSVLVIYYSIESKMRLLWYRTKKVKGCTHFYQRFFINFLNKNPISLLFVGIECSIFTFSWLHQLIDLLAILLGLEERIKSRCKANNKCR